MEEKFGKLKEVYQKLREEHINLLRLKADVDKQLATSNISKNEAVQSKERMEKEVEGMLTQISSAKEILAKGSQEQETQIHNLQASLMSTQAKLMEAENEARQKEETCFTMEKQLHERDNQILQLKLKGSDAEQNKNNLEMELNELNSEVNALKRSSQEQESSVEELKAQIETRTEELRVKTSDLSAMQETAERGYICAIEAAVAMMENIKHVEDVESVACSSFSLTYQSHHLSDLLTTPWPNDQAKQVGLISQLGDSVSLVWEFSKGVSGSCPDIDLGSQLSAAADSLIKESEMVVRSLQEDRESKMVEAKLALVKPHLDSIIGLAETVP